MSSEFHEKMKLAQTEALSTPSNWRSFRFWQEMFLYFFFFSIAGHYFEELWSKIYFLLSNGDIWHPSRITLIPSGPPYGFGCLAVLLLVIPLVQKYKIHPLTVFILNMVVTGFAEWLCAAVLVMCGGGHYWNYTGMPFNVTGYVWIGSAFLFSVITTPFVYWIYPVCEKILRKVQRNMTRFNIIFWVIFVFYAFEIAAICVRGRIY